MSDYGIFTYVQGTTLDAINSIDFNYVIDTLQITGTGSKVIDVDLSDGLTLQWVVYEQVTLVNLNSSGNILISGNVLTWTGLSYPCRVAVMGTYP